MEYSRIIMMGDPSHFRIKSGSNPHTRDRWGKRKQVDQEKALSQWHSMAKTLLRYAVQIYVIPADPDHTGLVFPANAGYVPDSDHPMPLEERIFIRSNLNPSRADEQSYYEHFVGGLGLRLINIRRSFEGEADLTRWNDHMIFTYGGIMKASWKFAWQIPPWKRRYGFRTSNMALQDLEPWLVGKNVLPLQLVDERYYHGDTVLGAFGPNRRYLLAYRQGLAAADQVLLNEYDNIIWLSDADAKAYAANSFPLEYQGKHTLFMPAGVSDELRGQVEALGVRTILIDVSEFLGKGGGAIKCMIGDLGAWAPEAEIDEATARFRREHQYSPPSD